MRHCTLRKEKEERTNVTTYTLKQTIPTYILYDEILPLMNSREISIFQSINNVRVLPRHYMVQHWIGIIFLSCWLAEWPHLKSLATDDHVCADRYFTTTRHDIDSDSCPNPSWLTHGGKYRASSRREQTVAVSHASTRKRLIGQLHPSDLPPPETFTDFHRSSSIKLPGNIEPQIIHHGTVKQINPIRNVNGNNGTGMIATTDILYLPQIMKIDDVDNVVKLLRNFQRYDEDPDTVDGMTTHEIFVDSPDLQNIMNQYHQKNCHSRTDQCDTGTGTSVTTSMKIRDFDPSTVPERIQLRRRLQSILQPILKERITPLIQTLYPKLCSTDKRSIATISGTDTRSCTPCFSLIRRYRYGERQSHGTHYDGHALITVVVSLSNYSTDYNGGLYVSTGYGQRQFVPLYSGDAVAHQSTLLHGVQVLPIASDAKDTERWSWILWYRDSTECIDYSYEWFVDCAKRGDAICQELYATKIGSIPVTRQDENYNETMNEQIRQHHNMESIVHWNRASAEKGNGNAAIKMARAYLKLLPSKLPYNQTEAIRYYKLAIQSHHPDGYYGMASLYVESLHQKNYANPKHYDKTLSRVVQLLEEAANRGHPYAMFNLGIVHCYGYGIHHVDTELAASWFIQSGLPEGFYAAAYQAAAMGHNLRQQRLDGIARKLGHYEPWRKAARERTGSGGASGVDLNLKWPVAADGRQPPRF